MNIYHIEATYNYLIFRTLFYSKIVLKMFVSNMIQQVYKVIYL